MKKLIALLMALLLAVPAFAAEPSLTEEDYTLRLSNEEDAPVFALSDEADALLAALADHTGAPVAMTFEDQDCMLPGMTREYLTADELFVLATRPLPGDPNANTIESVMVLTDSVTTHRGARVGMTLTEIEALYGTDHVLDYDTVLYANGDFDPQVMFFFDTETWVCVGWMLFRNMVI